MILRSTDVQAALRVRNAQRALQRGFVLDPYKVFPPAAGGGGTVWGTASPEMSAAAISNSGAFARTNGGKTVTASGVFIQASIRGTTSKATGKHYFEIRWSGSANSGDVLFGFGQTASQCVNYWQSDTNNFTCRGNGQVFYDGVNFASGGISFTSGDVVGFAIDVGVNIKVYVNNSLGLTFTKTTPANPAPYCWVDNGSTGQVYALRCAAADCTYSPPAGYANWD